MIDDNVNTVFYTRGNLLREVENELYKLNPHQVTPHFVVYCGRDVLLEMHNEMYGSPHSSSNPFFTTTIESPLVKGSKNTIKYNCTMGTIIFEYMPHLDEDEFFTSKQGESSTALLMSGSDIIAKFKI